MSDNTELIGAHVRITEGVNKQSQRTRNRIRENGSLGFIITDFIKRHPSLQNRSAVLLRSVGMSGDGSAWFGWLPINEIEIIPWEEK